jgi:hypothetical protein
MTSDEYRRRRRCLEVECGRTWPTLEGLDQRRFARELAAEGVNPGDLGLVA